MIIFGGIFDVTQELNDMHIYDLAKQKWVSFFEEMMSPVKKKKAIVNAFTGSDSPVRNSMKDKNSNFASRSKA